MIATRVQTRPDNERTRRHEHVLVVGHHQATLAMIEAALELEGYLVTVALASQAWIEQAVAPGANFLAIVLDVGYPTDATVTGLFSHLRSCWEAAHRRMPPLVVLTENQHLPDLTPYPVLLKPFHLRDLYQTLQQVRDGRGRWLSLDAPGTTVTTAGDCGGERRRKENCSLRTPNVTMPEREQP